MKKRLICLLLSAVMVLSLIPLTAVNVFADDETAVMSISDDAIEVLKAFEGFHKYAYYDYGQWSIGYGTACEENEYPNGISEALADTLMRQEVAGKEQYVRSFAETWELDLEQHQYDALVLFTYNFGQGWMSANGDFRQSIIDGDTGNDFIYNIARWCKAGGEPLISLLERRLCEADMYLNSNYTNLETRRENYTYVLFDSNDGSLDVLMQGYDADTPTVVRPVPYKTDCRFLGWYTEDEGGEWVTTLDYSTSEMTLHAHWQQGEGSTDGNGNVLGVEASYRYPAASIASLSVYETPDADAKVTGTVAATTTLSIVADYVDETDVKWGKLSTGGWVKLGKAVPDVIISDEQPVKVTITNSFVNVRQAAGADSDKVGTLSYGDRVTIYKTTLVGDALWGRYTGGWIALEYTDYELALENIENENMPVIATGVVTANSYLRIRKGPSTAYAEIGKLLPGDEIEIKQIKKVGNLEWGRIDEGWVCMTYVQLVEDEPDTPDATEKPDDTDTPDDTQKPEDTDTPNEPETSVLTGTVINTDQLRVRTGAGTANKEVMRLKSGTKVTIYEQTVVNGTPWGRIDEGWVCLNYIILDVTEENLKNVVTGTVISNTKLNVRTGAGTNYPKVTGLEKGTKVTVYEAVTVKNLLWGRIDEGWVCLEYVQLDAALPNVPEAPEATEPETPGESVTPSEPEELPEGVLYTGTVINTDELRVRTGAGTANPEVTRLTSGTEVNIYEETTVNGVLWGRTDLGWVAMTYIKVNPSTTDKENAVKGVVISNSNLNVRSAAGTHNMKVASLPTGTEVTVYEIVKVGTNEWGRIDQGWVCMVYIQIVEDEPEVPTETVKPDEEEKDDPETPTESVAPTEPETPVVPEELPEGALYSGTVINTDELRVRTGAGTKNEEITRLKQGTKVYIYEEVTADGNLWGNIGEGWVCMVYIKVNPTAEDLENAATGVVIAPNGMNVRSKPGAWNQQVGRLETGAEVQVFEITEVNGVAWGRIDGGWVAMQYIELVEDMPEDTEATESTESTETTESTEATESTESTETPDSDTTENPEDGEMTPVITAFEYTHAEYAALINEAIKNSGYVLMDKGEEDGMQMYALGASDPSAGTEIYLLVAFEMAENSDKVAGVTVVAPTMEDETIMALLRTVSEAAMKVADATIGSDVVDALHQMEPEVDTDGNTMQGMFYENVMLMYMETLPVEDDSTTEEDESAPAMAAYSIYAVEFVEAE